MKKNKLVWLLIFAFAVVGIVMGASSDPNSKICGQNGDFSNFQKAVEAHNDSNSVSMGDLIFNCLEQKFKDNAGFETYKSKLNAAKFLAQQMQQQLEKVKNTLMLEVDGKLYDKTNVKIGESLFSLAPAKHFYDSAGEIFSKPVTMSGLEDDERIFLTQYYNVKLRILTSAVAKAGQALAVADPAFRGTYDYTLVLPLLHASDKTPINIDILPRWMQQPGQLDVFSDSCLLHFGLPLYAMTIAKKSAQMRGTSLQEADFYSSAAEKCGKLYPHIAVDCLHRAIDSVPDNDVDRILALCSELVQLWLDSNNYTFAVSEAQKTFERYPNNAESGKFIWLYYYALSKSNGVDQILANIDSALADKRCEAYKARLMYIKWWSLRNKRPESAEIEILEYELLEKHANDPVVAPVLLAKSTDLLARQDYSGARRLLTQLSEKFPSTEAAAQANQILLKLETVK
jgi:hypothetical protein